MARYDCIGRFIQTRYDSIAISPSIISAFITINKCKETLEHRSENWRVMLDRRSKSREGEYQSVGKKSIINCFSYQPLMGISLKMPVLQDSRIHLWIFEKMGILIYFIDL